jgi:hypothetical protein
VSFKGYIWISDVVVSVSCSTHQAFTFVEEVSDKLNSDKFEGEKIEIPKLLFVALCTAMCCLLKP